MCPLYEFEEHRPVISPEAFVHPQAVLIGDVTIGDGCYIGPFASLRGDFGKITIGAGGNVQDCCVLHSYPEAETVVAEEGHIGHGAILHGCKVGRGALVGMKSVIMDGVEIGEFSIIAASSLLLFGSKIPPKSLVMGNPAKVTRELAQAEIDRKRSGTEDYQELARRSLATLKLLD